MGAVRVMRDDDSVSISQPYFCIVRDRNACLTLVIANAVLYQYFDSASCTKVGLSFERDYKRHVIENFVGITKVY